MFTIRKTLIFSVLITCALLAGCGSKRVDYLDNDDVEVKVQWQEIEGDFLVAHMAFTHGDEDAVAHTVYKVEWLNDDDTVIETTSWRPLIVKGRRSIPVTERSTVPGAVDLRILISNDPS